MWWEWGGWWENIQPDDIQAVVCDIDEEGGNRQHKCQCKMEGRETRLLTPWASFVYGAKVNNLTLHLFPLNCASCSSASLPSLLLRCASYPRKACSAFTLNTNTTAMYKFLQYTFSFEVAGSLPINTSDPMVIIRPDVHMKRPPNSTPRHKSIPSREHS